jgi:hypothetical protein
MVCRRGSPAAGLAALLELLSEMKKCMQQHVCSFNNLGLNSAAAVQRRVWRMGVRERVWPQRRLHGRYTRREEQYRGHRHHRTSNYISAPPYSRI